MNAVFTLFQTMAGPRPSAERGPRGAQAGAVYAPEASPGGRGPG